MVQGRDSHPQWRGGTCQADMIERSFWLISLREYLLQEEYLLRLDNRVLQTPGRHLVAIPSYPLALAIAAEWQWQASASWFLCNCWGYHQGKVGICRMPTGYAPSPCHSCLLRRLQSTRHDLFCVFLLDTMPRSQPFVLQPKGRSYVIDSMLRYLHTDLYALPPYFWASCRSPAECK